MNLDEFMCYYEVKKRWKTQTTCLNSGFYCIQIKFYAKLVL
jgi:hypothetical protein